MIRSAYRWLDDRLGISSAILPLIEHPVPRSINWWYVLGSATLVAFIVQVVTGVALAFSYVPAPISACGPIKARGSTVTPASSRAVGSICALPA